MLWRAREMRKMRRRDTEDLAFVKLSFGQKLCCV
jgi:hypothetical protein